MALNSWKCRVVFRTLMGFVVLGLFYCISTFRPIGGTSSASHGFCPENLRWWVMPEEARDLLGRDLTFEQETQCDGKELTHYYHGTFWGFSSCVELTFCPGKGLCSVVVSPSRSDLLSVDWEQLVDKTGERLGKPSEVATSEIGRQGSVSSESTTGRLSLKGRETIRSRGDIDGTVVRGTRGPSALWKLENGVLVLVASSEDANHEMSPMAAFFSPNFVSSVRSAHATRREMP